MNQFLQTSPMMREENFIYSTGWSDPMAVIGAAQEMDITIASDADFKVYYLTLAVRQGAVGVEVLVGNWAGDVNLNDSAIGKNLMNVPIPADGLNGTGQWPYNFSPPRIFNSRSTIVVQFTSNVATRTECNLSLHGAKLFAL